MTERLAYDDADTTQQMHLDCAACGDRLRLPTLSPRPGLAERAVAAPPSILFEDYPKEITKREITVSDATALLAARLFLQQD